MTTTTTQTPDSTKVLSVVPPTQNIVVTPKSLDAADRRRDWALFALVGGGTMMTLYALAVLYLVRIVPNYVFYLGLFAMINILVLFTGIAGLLVKRTVNVTKQGVLLEDHDNGSKDQ